MLSQDEVQPLGRHFRAMYSLVGDCDEVHERRVVAQNYCITFTCIFVLFEMAEENDAGWRDTVMGPSY